MHYIHKLLFFLRICSQRLLCQMATLTHLVGKTHGLQCLRSLIDRKGPEIDRARGADRGLILPVCPGPPGNGDSLRHAIREFDEVLVARPQNMTQLAPEVENSTLL